MVCSSSVTSVSSVILARRRSLSLAIMDSALGASLHSAVMPASRRRRSALRRRLGATIRAETPLRPARPVRPDRWRRASRLRGTSACTTSSRLGRSIPRAATSVAIQTCARPSRSACSALLRSAWDSSPEMATTENPRLLNRCVMRFTATRVSPKTIAFFAL